MTPAAIARAITLEQKRGAVQLWRAVEAQHLVATQALVDTLGEQAELERILDAAKPAIDTAGPRGAPLHWLLYTPFRYPPLPSGSRFRGPSDPGVWYGAEHVRTACAELGYWRWRFLIASPDLEMLVARPQTVFRARLRGLAIDLRRGAFAAARANWTDPASYAACQALARQARAAGISLVRYDSVRDPEHAGCGAALTSGAFAAPAPSELQTWLLDVRRDRVTWTPSSPLTPLRFEFRFLAGAGGRAS